MVKLRQLLTRLLNRLKRKTPDRELLPCTNCGEPTMHYNGECERCLDKWLNKSRGDEDE